MKKLNVMCGNHYETLICFLDSRHIYDTSRSELNLYWKCISEGYPIEEALQYVFGELA